jgi:hypothetical protein
VIGRSDLPQPPSSPQGGESQPRRAAIGALLRTVAMFGVLLLAIWVSTYVGAWWVGVLLIGLIFGAAALIFAGRR